MLSRTEFQNAVSRYCWTGLPGMTAAGLCSIGYFIALKPFYPTWERAVAARYGESIATVFALLMIAAAVAIFLLLGSLVIVFVGRDKRGVCRSCGRSMLSRGKFVLRTNRCPECDAVVFRNNSGH